jgi:hypothetical protein
VLAPDSPETGSIPLLPPLGVRAGHGLVSCAPRP